MEANKYLELRKIDVSKHIEKKNGLSYLSWAWAVDQLLQADPMATWEYREPVRFNETMMVFCAVTAFGKTLTAQLPVMDHRNKAIANPDAFAVNTAMQRCLAKAIALHGIGLYIYAGEDLPEQDKAEPKRVDVDGYLERIAQETDLAKLRGMWKQIAAECQEAMDVDASNLLKAKLTERGEQLKVAA